MDLVLVELANSTIPSEDIPRRPQMSFPVASARPNSELPTTILPRT